MTRIQERRFAGHDSEATIEAHHGALRHLLELCRDHGIPSAIPEAYDQLFAKAVHAGHAGDDFAALHTVMR